MSVSRLPKRAFLLGFVFIVASLVGSGAAAYPGPPITWYPGPGQSATDAYYWHDISPAYAHSIVFGLDTQNVVYSTDYDSAVSHMYAWPYCDGSSNPDPGICTFREGVDFEQSYNYSASWSNFARLNPDQQQGTRPTIAVDGSNIYVAWVSQSSYYTHQVGSGPRQLWFISNNNSGAVNAWNYPGTSLTSAKGQVDYPSLAAVNGRVYLAWTNGQTGKVYVAVSTNGGTTWSRHVISSDSATLGGPYPYGQQGYSARPALGVSDDGQTVGVAWLSGGFGYKLTREGSYSGNLKLEGAVSTDGGSHWGNYRSLGTTTVPPTGSGATDRVGFTLINSAGTAGYEVEFDKGSGWSAKYKFVQLPDAMVPSHVLLDSASVGLYGTSQVGIAFGGCMVPKPHNPSRCKLYGVNTQGVDLMWTESADGGATWTDPTVIYPSDGASWMSNDVATVSWQSPTWRNVDWNGFTPDYWHYQTGYAAGLG